MDLQLGSFVDLSALYWCRECQGYSPGKKRCSACHEPRLETKPGTNFKRVRKKPPFPLLGGVHYSGRIVKTYVRGSWQIYTTWETEYSGRLIYPATCPVNGGDEFKVGKALRLRARNDYFKVMNYLGEYLANIDIEDPAWRCVDVISGEVLDTTDWDYINDQVEFEHGSAVEPDWSAANIEL